MPWQESGPHRWGDRVGGWGPPGRRRRPPWWPDNEAWPPEGSEAWRRLRRGFMRRALGFAAFLFILVVAATAGVFWLLHTLLGEFVLGFIPAVMATLIMALILRGIVRGFRSTAVPVGELIEASGRMEAGKLGIQVPERGPREVRELTRAFNAMSHRLARTEEQRRRLLADVSHELRTPLTVIQGNVEAMLDGVYPADREHLERIRAESRQLEQLIDDLRTLSLAESGGLALQREALDVAGLARDVVDGFRPRAEGAGVELVVDAPAPAEAELDPQRTRQVLANLIANAVRHAPGAKVTVSVRTTPAGVVVAVSDTGPGMAAEEAGRAFERFTRGGQSPGAGLGLAIVRDLVEAHGGRVELVSEPGAGTTVTCTFPAGPSAG